MHVRAFAAGDRLELERLARGLFPDADTLFSPQVTWLVVDRGDGRLGGYIELGTRPYADGCDSSPVAYVEAWYVDPDLRGQGWGRALVAAAEAWAREHGLTELASGSLIENERSIAAHLALGFTEVERQVHFAKKL